MILFLLFPLLANALAKRKVNILILILVGFFFFNKKILCGFSSCFSCGFQRWIVNDLGLVLHYIFYYPVL